MKLLCSTILLVLLTVTPMASRADTTTYGASFWNALTDDQNRAR